MGLGRLISGERLMFLFKKPTFKLLFLSVNFVFTELNVYILVGPVKLPSVAIHDCCPLVDRECP